MDYRDLVTLLHYYLRTPQTPRGTRLWAWQKDAPEQYSADTGLSITFYEHFPSFTLAVTLVDIGATGELSSACTVFLIVHLRVLCRVPGGDEGPSLAVNISASIALNLEPFAPFECGYLESRGQIRL